MTTVLRMPDGTHVRVNASDVDKLLEQDGWTLVGPAQDDPRPMMTSDLQEEPQAKAKPMRAPQTKVVKPSEA